MTSIAALDCLLFLQGSRLALDILGFFVSTRKIKKQVQYNLQQKTFNGQNDVGDTTKVTRFSPHDRLFTPNQSELRIASTIVEMHRKMGIRKKLTWQKFARAARNS